MEIQHQLRRIETLVPANSCENVIWASRLPARSKIRARCPRYARYMENVTVSHRSALARWGEKDLAQRLGEPCPADSITCLTTRAALNDDLLRDARLTATNERPLHVLFNDQVRRMRTTRVVSHVWSTPLPEGALYQLTPGVLLCSPSFCLLQLCARASAGVAAATAMEICGNYALSASAPHGFFERPPLATLPELKSRFENSRQYGAGRVRSALARAVPGSRSPMETAVVLLFTMPIEQGGCALPVPSLNTRVEIPPDLRAALGRPYLVVDLCWKQQRIILEYDSYTWHLQPRAFDGTQSRNEGLRDEGWMVRTVTAGILTDSQLRRLLVSRVMRRFGLRPPDDPAFELRQSALVHDLLALHGA